MQPVTQLRRLFPVAMVLCICLAFPGTGLSAPNQLALVNNVPIAREDIDREAAIIAADIQLRNLPWTKEQIAVLGRQILGTLIDRELLYQQARQRNIEIRSQWIERALIDLKSRVGGTDAFENYLKSTGLNEDQLRERLQRGLIVRRLLHREVIRRIRVSEAEMQAFFRRHPEFFVRKDQVRVRQIFVAFPRGNDAAARAEALLRIQSIQDRLSQGANFAALALEYSDDPSKAKGGDLGYLERNQMIPAFADAAFALQTGEVSDIVQSRIGYHLIKMVDRRPASQMVYRNTRTKIERTLRRNKEKAAIATYLAKLKREAKVIVSSRR